MSKNILDPEIEQYMLDLETLSLEPNAVIVSIGATKFTINDGIIDKFSVNIDPFDAKSHGLHIDPDTVAWWKGQPKEISDLWKVDPQPLRDALTKFCLWFGGKSLPIYGNSPSFDCIAIKESMKVTGIPCPWNFRDEVDYRTICKLIDIPFTKNDHLHSALDDAVSQTEHLLQILRS